MSIIILTVLITIAIIAIFIVFIMPLRRVVPTNVVHIVQYRKQTISFGKGQAGGNVYYEFPTWLPFFGMVKRELPVSNFDLDLQNYEAYDKDRLPFVLDIKAFFRISDTNEAANKVESFAELRNHLTGIVQGSVRSIMANAKLEEIMSERSVYGERFTIAVFEQLKEWGVVPVKNIELMDLRDSKDSKVIENIMAKKKSEIEKESRIEVAQNKQLAESAEIEASKTVALKKQEAHEAVGKREAEVNKTVGIMNEKTQQDINDEAKTTKEKEMAIAMVAEVKRAEIDKQTEIIVAEQKKNVQIIEAEAQLESQRRIADSIVVKAEAELTANVKSAEGVKVQGLAKGEAIKAEGLAIAESKKAEQLASVTAQTTLAKEIGANKEYQEYLIRIEQINADKAVGISQAENLKGAEIKVIANAENINGGIENARKIFSTQTGTNLGATLEAFANTDVGKVIIEKFLKK